MSGKDSKRPHSEVAPDTPPQEFSLHKMKVMMEELFDAQFRKMGLENVGEDIKTIQKDVLKINKDVEIIKEDSVSLKESVNFIEESSKEAKAMIKGHVKEVEHLREKVNHLEKELTKEKESRLSLETEQRKINPTC